MPDSEPASSCQHEHCQQAVALPAAAQLEMAAAMCSALSDVGRLRLVLRLMNSPDGELCVSELVEHEQAKASSISARLQVLHAARLLTRRREMKHIYYSLADDHVRHLVLNILGHAAEPVSSTPQPLQEHTT
ncbi:MAG: ArsR/SmtB family transcription factor [Ottowia sp.]